MEELLGSNYEPYLPDQLIAHLRAQELIEENVDYQLPSITFEDEGQRDRIFFTTKPTDVRIPARLMSALIPYPPEMCVGIYQKSPHVFPDLHDHHRSQLESLSGAISAMEDAGTIPQGEIHYSLDMLKPFARQTYSSRETLISLSAAAFAKRATKHDLSIAAGTEIPFTNLVSKTSAYTPFVIMIQRLRTHIVKEKAFPRFDPSSELSAPGEALYTMYDTGVYHYRSNSKMHSFHLIACGGHFRFFHSALGYWFAGPVSYLDYVFSISDILSNLDALRECEEYRWALDVFSLMTKFAEHEGHHKEQVDFMKGLEGLFLTMSDYDEDFAMNWKPILETTRDLWKLDMAISDCQYDYALVLTLMSGKAVYSPQQSFLCKFIKAGKLLTRTQCQEVSALHKLIFYAEVSASAGVEKFLRRVHTPRSIDSNAIKNITRLAKQLIVISYRKKHKTLPNLIAPVKKIKLLEMYSRRGLMHKAEELALSWWDDIKVFDCMDNTLTTDPLEFAKDKGALKSQISFGPGDSRKELLQVIEREKYTLRDFFKGRVIKPKPKKVVRRKQARSPTHYENPARLIEKEREQKWAARLFANGELENKHSLSLVAAKMKKALSYFDEQLMTPSDRKRKSLIHEAARALGHPDNYSLLLDIEGHNQSMQHSNTAELAEFIGHLFGEDGWGDLPHYFGQLDVYHYDEYIDDVLHSTGQLGGIEGWLNPLWTLHTLLMMKLLRVMTDLTVETIMVYSDDVDAIVRISQASEAMVQSVFQKVMSHCKKFGMTVKYSQTTLSKHRITMLRQHYADGVRADSTLKRLLSVSSCNNPTVVADELEVSGICSSSSSALELSNHNEACSYLKNYKLGLLLARLPHMVLREPEEGSMISHSELPKKFSNLLYYTKEDASQIPIASNPGLQQASVNDIAAYLGRHPKTMSDFPTSQAIGEVYGVGVAEERLADNADRLLYLQIYDAFAQDLLFFWTYLPTALGGLGASLHLDLILSGHSVGMTKSLHYLFQWVVKYSVEKEFFLRYLSTVLSVDLDEPRNVEENRLVNTNWPSDSTITPVTSSVQSAIRHMVRRHAKNVDIIKLFEMSDESGSLAGEYIELFRGNFHSRVVQFYHENTAIHFIDLLLNKVETSSGLLTRVRNLTRLRGSLSSRAVQNIRLAASTTRTYFFMLKETDDIVQCMMDRKTTMFPKIRFIKVEEILYDDKVTEVDRSLALLTVRRCAPTHFRDGRRVYDDPKVGNETLYKGELLDNDRMLGNKEELLAAKLVAVTKWFLTKSGKLAELSSVMESLDIVKACNLSLSTLTTQTFKELVNYAPTETGGEILHRIPNIRFSTATYIRAEMNRSLHYTTDLNQRLLTSLGLVDSNVNVDYLRMRYLTAAVLRDKYDETRRLVMRYGFSNLVGIYDVQFVSPHITPYAVKKTFGCYGELRGHILSKLRFRYLAHSYLYEENMTDWALMPNLHEAKTAAELGNSFINDIIIRYARDLDKDYLLLHPTIINADIWKPLSDKLDKIDRSWRGTVRRSPTEEIRDRLIRTLDDRGRMTLVDPTDKIGMAIQSQCLTNLDTYRVRDDDFASLSRQYSSFARAKRTSRPLNKRLARYQAMLAEFAEYKKELALNLLCEYIITFHFKVHRSREEVMFNVNASMDEFFDAGIGSLSYTIIAPELQFQLLVLDHLYVTQIATTFRPLLREFLTDISTDTSLADIDVPTSLPSLTGHTILTGMEEIPSRLDEIEYQINPVGFDVMASLEDLAPLCRFAHRCSTTGADPAAFGSPTGSDSLGAQIGLFRALMTSRWIDTETRICDLTAGRGDGAYAFSHLGLNATSYSRTDTFTRLNYHPQIQFLDHYDIFDGSTLKFVIDFDHVHVDLSFPGHSDSNILDLVLMLEEHNLQYSIRLNSTALVGYGDALSESRPLYRHSLAYAGNATMKPYQIYLLGRPSESPDREHGPGLKDSMAFRSMAVSFARLLAPQNACLRLTEYEPNSVSLQIPTDRDFTSLLSNLLEESIAEEQKYYLSRMVSEVGPDALVVVDTMKVDAKLRKVIEPYLRSATLVEELPYGKVEEKDIGNVSKRSLPYHVKHLESLNDPGAQLTGIPILNCGMDMLELMRTRHPLAEVRTWCNIVIGLRTYCIAEYNSGYDAIQQAYLDLQMTKTVRTSMHQREVFLALKLMVLAASKDCYEYGVNYCRELCNGNTGRAASLHRTLKIYRLSSYLFHDIQKRMASGLIDIRSINSIANSLEVRERLKYKYKRAPEAPQDVAFDPDLADKILGNQMEKILEGFEKYSQALVNIAGVNEDGQDLRHILEGANLVFDLSIEQQVNDAIDRLGLKPSGPYGIIDLGDEDLWEDDM